MLNGTMAIHPAMSALDEPATRLEAGLLFDGLGLFASGTDMRGKAEFPDNRSNLIEVVPLVQADALGRRRRRFRTHSHQSHSPLPSSLQWEFHEQKSCLLK